jgi:short-subunit dehydrogenase
LCPGPVITGFQQRAGFRPGFDTALLGVSPEDVAGVGYRGLMSNKRVVLPGFLVSTIPFMLRFAPKWLVLAAASRLQNAR